MPGCWADVRACVVDGSRMTPRSLSVPPAGIEPATLRIKQALQRLAEGDNHLGRLAADLGFSDQSHFTRVTRLEVGATAGQLRALLSLRIEPKAESQQLDDRLGGTVGRFERGTRSCYPMSAPRATVDL